MINRLNPLNDYLFLKMMGEKGDEEQLMSFLNAVLSRTGRKALESVEIVDPKLTAEIVGDKASVLDVRAVTNDGIKTNIEVQLKNLSNMGKRSLFYWSREYNSGIVSGQDYIELPNVIAINIMGFPFLKIDDFHACFHLREDRHPEYVLDDALELHFLDISKFVSLCEKDIQNNPLHRWLSFFDPNTDVSVLREVLDMDNAIRKASDKMTFVSQDPESFRYYQMREMGLSDITSSINYARKEGEARGKIMMIRSFIAAGFDAEQIRKIAKEQGVAEDDLEDEIKLI